MIEANLQQKCVVWYNNNRVIKGLGIIFSVPNEATYQNKRFKNTGVLPGVSDLIVMEAGRVMFFELKTKTGQQSPAQAKFQEKVEALGYQYHIIKDLISFITKV